VLDEKLKSKAELSFEEFGLNLSEGVRMLIALFIK
jgi:antitoxin component of RelBE/YafQ-DinJ toxin-antitoxin module